MITHKFRSFLACVFLSCAAFAPAAVDGSISGTVTFEDGASAAGAIVKWRSLDAGEGMSVDLFNENRATCGKDGSFRCEKLPKGPYRLEVTARPAKAASDWFVVVPEVKDGAQGVKIVMKCGSAVRGRVVDAAGKPVRSFSVRAVQSYRVGKGSMATSGPPSRAFDDAGGSFVFECLPDGDWEFAVVSNAPPPLWKSVKVHLPSKDGEPIVLTAPDSTTHVVTGHVVDPSGKPVKGATVRISPHNDEGMISISPDNKKATTDEKGVFRFEGVRVAAMQVVASHDGFGSSEALVLDLSKPLPVDITLMLRASGKLRGTVVDAAGKPVAGCTVLAMIEGEVDIMNSTEAKTDTQGKFEFQSLAPGRYEVSGTTEKSHASGRMYGEAIAEIKAGETAEIALTIRKSS